MICFLLRKGTGTFLPSFLSLSLCPCLPVIFRIDDQRFPHVQPPITLATCSLASPSGCTPASVAAAAAVARSRAAGPMSAPGGTNPGTLDRSSASPEVGALPFALSASGVAGALAPVRARSLARFGKQAWAHKKSRRRVETTQQAETEKRREKGKATYLERGVRWDTPFLRTQPAC